uniref:Myosin motor domain-containing protein n=1 Tax=Arcella intermedia TaxID=1963864 RepID=A0A6B2KX44_9EUKA
MQNLKKRYEKKQIYTYIGPILVSVNPFQPLPIYHEDEVKKYLETKSKEENPSHLFYIASSAYKSLMDFGKSQGIIISGESGAGKSECTKRLLKFFTDIASTNNDRLANYIQSTGPILDSLGNAKTRRNENSSRFGKFIKLLFDKKKGHFEISGAEINTYLLEKTRVTFQDKDERNYHVFHQMINYCSPEQKAKYQILQSELDYKYLGKEIALPGDKKQFEIFLSALEELKFSTQEIDAIFYLLSAILHLGNVTIVKGPNDSAVIENPEVINIFCDLINKTSALDSKKVSPSKMIEALTHKTFLKDKHSVSVVEAIRYQDTLARELYSMLFDWVVFKLNASLLGTSSEDSIYIGILDIFGFENFSQFGGKNSLEQLLINYANEKLQSQFNETIFKAEQEDYNQEGIKWENIDYEDNSACVSLIDDRARSIMSILYDLLLQMNRSNKDISSDLDKSLIVQLEETFKIQKGKPSPPQAAYFVKRGPKEADPLVFSIRHFAGETKYNVTKWNIKNGGNLTPLLKEAMESFGNLIVTDMVSPFVPEATPSTHLKNPIKALFNKVTHKQPATPSKGTNVSSVCATYQQKLNNLMSMLSTLERHYVRCIKPNDIASPFLNHWDEHKILDQLRCNGIVESIKVRKAGYPHRIPFTTFQERYGSVIALYNNKLEMFSKLDPSGTISAMGRTKYFLKDQLINSLNQKRRELQAALTIQIFVRSSLAIEKYNNIPRPVITPLPKAAPPQKIVADNVVVEWPYSSTFIRPPNTPYQGTALPTNRPQTTRKESQQNIPKQQHPEIRIYREKKDEALKLSAVARTKVPLFKRNLKIRAEKQNQINSAKKEEERVETTTRNERIITEEKKMYDNEDVDYLRAALKQHLESLNLPSVEEATIALKATESQLLKVKVSARVQKLKEKREALLTILHIDQLIASKDTVVSVTLEEIVQQCIDNDFHTIEELLSALEDKEKEIKTLDPKKNSFAYESAKTDIECFSPIRDLWVQYKSNPPKGTNNTAAQITTLEKEIKEKSEELLQVMTSLGFEDEALIQSRIDTQTKLLANPKLPAPRREANTRLLNALQKALEISNSLTEKKQSLQRLQVKCS